MGRLEAPPQGVHVHVIPVRFGDCDPAGIVYFPRFFDFFHQAMETWFTERLGFAYAELIGRRKIGFPAVHSEADFRVPTRMGESIAVELRIGNIGQRSLRFDYAVVGTEDPPGSGPRVSGTTTCVAMNLDRGCPDHGKAVPIPDDLRAAMTHFASHSPTSDT